MRTPTHAAQKHIGIRGAGVLDTATQAITGSSNSFYVTGAIHMSGVRANADIDAAFQNSQ